MTRVWALLGALCSACSSGRGGFYFTGDGGLPGPDFSVTVGADLSVPPGQDLATPSRQTYRYVMNRLLLPMARIEYGLDLNGDGRADNQLGNVIGALASQGIDPQAGADQAVAGGRLIQLVGLESADPTLGSDGGAGATLQRGRSQGAPDFGGSGTFVPDGTAPLSRLAGSLSGSRFTSEDPTTIGPVAVELGLPLLAGADPVVVTLQGARVRFTTGRDAESGAPGLLEGQLNGSIRERDVMAQIIPAMADSFNAQIASDPFSPTAQMILSLFDGGGCAGAFAEDGFIDACELWENSIIRNVLAPDVDIYDANGLYAPNPANTAPDSLSLGVGFTAVRAFY